MKRRWTIVRHHAMERMSVAARMSATMCESAMWYWVRTSKVNGGEQLIGCVCHHTWTGVVRRYSEVPNAPR